MRRGKETCPAGQSAAESKAIAWSWATLLLGGVGVAVTLPTGVLAIVEGLSVVGAGLYLWSKRSQPGRLQCGLTLMSVAGVAEVVAALAMLTVGLVLLLTPQYSFFGSIFGLYFMFFVIPVLALAVVDLVAVYYVRAHLREELEDVYVERQAKTMAAALVPPLQRLALLPVAAPLSDDKATPVPTARC
jgi:uncharacterized membrane protein